MEKLYQRLFFVLILCLPASQLVAQSLTGKITDQSGIAVSGASLHIQGLTSTVSNSTGEYFFKLPSKGSYRVKITSSLHQPQSQDVFVKGNKVSNFVLQPLGSVREEKSVTGSRRLVPVSNYESSTPVDIITSADLKMFAQKDVTQILNYAMQSFSSNRQSIAGGTDHIDPISLSGLGPDQVLILVNGKRRHSTALVNIDGTVGRGAAGTDMNSIPVSSIERIEILRSGASAQYGSDAVAGAINIILKSNSPFNMSMSFGQTASNTLGRNFNDGKTFQVDYSEGIDLAGRGSLNFSGQYLYRGATDRSGLDTRPLLYSALPKKKDCECDEAFQQRYGELKSADDQLALASGLSRDNMRVGNAESANGGFLVNGQFSLLKNAELYLTAGYTLKAGEAAGFSRLPSETTQIDLSMYPNGYLPLINSGITDLSVASGLRGRIAGWNYDLSHITGKNKIDFHISRSLNASLPLGTSPNNFNAGELSFRQNTSNLDISRRFAFSGPFKSVNAAFGAEYRSDNYEIGKGEELSYSFGQPSKGIPGRKMGSQYAQAGAQVFQGFTPGNALSQSRNNRAVYADFETEVGSRVRLGLAGRLENYSDFGSNFSYKSTGRYNFYKDYSVRAAYSTGFKAPSLHQRYFNNESSSIINGLPSRTLIANNESSIVNQFGIGSLRPELSNSYSFGLTGKITKNISIAADAYQIDIDDRIVLSGAYSRERDSNGAILPGGDVNQILNRVDPVGYINSVQFFANAVSTRTRGLDLLVSDRFKLRSPGQSITLSASLNLNKTTAGNIYVSDQISNNSTLTTKLFDRQERSRIESALPNSKVNLTANFAAKNWGMALRTVRFGEVAYNNPFNPAFPEVNTPLIPDQTFAAKWVTDLTMNYTFTNELNIAFGVSNLLDVYPDTLYMDPNNRQDNLSGDLLQNYTQSASRDHTANGRIPYSSNVTQFGFNGRHIFGKLTYSL
ncbi:TonB-dependent receptor [Flavihumibacter sp. R14]|nr:TonB-dependent receptor [Flavihumibacter soli]